MKPLAILLCAILVGGCASFPYQRVESQIRERIVMCPKLDERPYLASYLTSYLARMQCLNGQIYRTYLEHDFPYMDVLAEFLSARIQLAVAFDNGQMTFEQLTAQLESLSQLFAGRIQQRAAQDADRRAAAWAQFGASMQQAGAILQQAAPPPPVNCVGSSLGGGTFTMTCR